MPHIRYLYRPSVDWKTGTVPELHQIQALALIFESKEIRTDLVEGIHLMKMMDDVRLYHSSFDTLSGGWKANDSFHYAVRCGVRFLGSKAHLNTKLRSKSRENVERVCY